VNQVDHFVREEAKQAARSRLDSHG
jgi:hypothetical protein